MIAFLVVVFWLLCGVIASMIGSTKGETVLGFLVGVVLGPVGVIIALLSRGNRKQCPYCIELVNRAAIVCPHCQRDIRPRETTNHRGRELSHHA